MRKEGYDIGTSAMLDVQRLVANINDEDIQSPGDLKYLLGPIVCRNKEEQQKFYKLFDEYIASVDEQEIVLENETVQVVPVKKKQWIWWLLIPIIVAAIAWVVSLLAPKDKPVTSGIIEYDFLKSKLIGDTVKLKVEYADSSKSGSYKTDWQLSGQHNFARSFKDSSQVSVVFDSAGSYMAIASTFSKQGALLKSDTATIEVLCEEPPAVTIAGNATDSTEGSFTATIDAVSPSDTAYKYHWFVNDTAVPGDSNMTTNLLKTNQPNIIRVMVDWPGKQIHCSVDSLTDELNLQPPVELIVAGDPKAPLTSGRSYNWSNILLSISGLLLLPLATAAVVRWRLRKRKPEPAVENEAPREEEKEKEYKGPFTIEFNSQHSKIMPEAGISQLAEVLRKRHTSDVFMLSINKTIKSTIRKGGFPVLEYIPRTQPADFLILIDKEYPDGHLTKLFTYVIDRLKKEQVHLTVYSFSREPLLLSNENLNHILLPIDKVARLYPETMLLIFSQADAFFRSYDVILKKWATEKFKSWNSKLIITPAAKKDWGVKELALYDAGFTVVPADINAHSIISDEINQMIDRQLLKKEIVPESYGSRQFNFSRWRQVTSYLKAAVKENNDRFNHVADQALLEQWLCSLAVYPHINWDVTIAIGKAFEDKYSKPGQLVNYTNLLVLSRIQWMNDEQLMDSLRVEMMNHLEEDKQVLARKVIVELMKEIEPKISEDSLVKDELQFLETTNKFLLNANDKISQELTEEELQQFKDYLKNDQVDWALQTYLEGTNTLLKDPANPAQTLPLNQYIKTQEEQEQKDKKIEKLNSVRTVKDLLRKMAPAAVFIVVAIISYVLLNKAGKLKLIGQQLADIAFNITGDSSENAIEVNSLSLLLNQSTYPATASEKNSFIVKNVPIADSAATLKVSSSAGDYQSDFRLGSSSYTVDLKSQKFSDTTKPNVVVSNDSLPNEVNEIWDVDDVFRIVAFYLKPKLFYYADRGRTPADAVQIVESNLIESNTYRVILQAKAGAMYEALFVRNITASGMEWLRCRANTFNTLVEARKATYISCGSFTRSTVSYVKTAAYNSNTSVFKIELPLNNLNLYSTELQKLRVAQKKYAGLDVNEVSFTTITISLNGFYKFDRDVQQRQNEIRRSIIGTTLNKAKWLYKPFSGNAFQRDYVTIDFSSLTDVAGRPDCNRVFKSLEEALTVKPAVICKLDLSGKNLYNMPDEIYRFTNLQTLSISGNYIPQSQVDKFKKSFPNCQIIDQAQPNNKNALDAVLKAALGEVKPGASEQY